MKGLLQVAVLSLIAVSCSERETKPSHKVNDTSATSAQVRRSIPILPVNCPTVEEIANDPTFGKYRSPSCSSRRPEKLKDLLEPSLEIGVPKHVTAYRLLMESEYAPDQIIRLQKIGENIEIIKKETLPSKIGKRFTTWKAPRTNTITQHAWAEWMMSQDSSGFWHLEPLNVKEIAIGGFSASWRLEAIRGGRYHNVYRGENTADQSFIHLCKRLIAMAGKRTQRDTAHE